MDIDFWTWSVWWRDGFLRIFFSPNSSHCVSNFLTFYHLPLPNFTLLEIILILYEYTIFLKFEKKKIN